MDKAKDNKTSNVDQFYEYCWTNNKLPEGDVDKLLTLVAMNNYEMTDGMLRGYLPISWASCVNIARAMEAGGIAKHVDHFTEPVVHLPFEDRQGWWREP